MKDILPLEHMEINDPNSHSLPRKNFLQLAGMFGGALAVPDILSKKEFISSNPVSTYLSTTISGINGAYRFLVTTGENPNTNGLNYIPDVNINMVGIEKITDDSIELTNLGQILTTAPFEKQSQIRAGVKLFEYRGIPITQDMVQVGKDGKTTQLADLAKDVFSNLNGDGYILGDIRLRVIEAPGQKHSDTSLRISIHSEDDKVVATNINLIEVQPKKIDSNQIKFDYTANKIVLRGYQRPELKPEVLAPKTVEQLDISNPEAFRTEKWEYLISPAYLADLKEKDRKGELPSLPENPSYVKPGYMSFNPDKTPTTMIKNNGFDLLFTISSSSLYSVIEKRPFELVDIAKTKIKGVDFYFYVIKWENDPSITNEPGFLGYITPISDYTDKIGLNELTGNTPETYVTGLYISDTEGKVTTSGCKKVLDNTINEGTSIEPFCEYLAKNQEILIQPEIYRLWSEKGMLINNNVIPISFASLKNTSK